MNIISLVVILSSSVPPVIRAVFTVPNVMVQNSMACRVYRLLKLGIITNTTEAFTLQPDNLNLQLFIAKPDQSGRDLVQTAREVENAHSHPTNLTLPNVIHSRVSQPLQVQIRIDKGAEIGTGNKVRLGFEVGELG